MEQKCASTVDSRTQYILSKPLKTLALSVYYYKAYYVRLSTKDLNFW